MITSSVGRHRGGQIRVCVFTGVDTSLGKARGAFWQSREVGETPASCEGGWENYSHTGRTRCKRGREYGDLEEV